MTRYRTLGSFLLLAALWGGSFVAVRAGLPDVPPVLFAALRFDLAGAVVFAYAVATTGRWYPRTREEWTVVCVGGALFVAAHHALLFVGQQYVTSAVAGVVVATDPVLAAGFARLLLPDERLSPVGFVGLLVGLFGIVVVARPAPDSLGSASVRGVALVALSAAAFALGAVLTRRFRTDLPVPSMQAWMLLVGAPLLHGVALVLPGESLGVVEWSTTALVSLAYLALGAGGLGYLLYFDLLDRLGPVELNLVGYLVPVVAGLGGWLLLGEAVDAATVVGFGLVVTGFALVKHEALREEVGRLGLSRSGP